MDRTTNPYRDLPLEQLWDALQARAGELQARRPRPPEEREALASDTAMLLLTAAAAIAPAHHSGGPERDMDSVAGFAAAFARWNDELVRGVRHRVLVRAANAALGGRTRAWLRDGRLGGQRAYDVAMASDEGLQLVLGALQELRGAR